MRTTSSLFKHHVGRMMKKHWHIQGKVKVYDSKVDEILKAKNFKVHNLRDLDPPMERISLRDQFPIPRSLPLNENHPDWKSTPMYIYRDNDVLVEGINQARKLTKSEEILDLPASVKELEDRLELSPEFHEETQKKIMQSCIFDPCQVKLPKRKDPERPAWRFPRDYGISEERKNFLLLNNLLDICEQNSGDLSKAIMNDCYFSMPIRAFNKDIQLEMKSEVVVKSATPLPPTKANNSEVMPIPDLYPVDCTITLNPYNFYTKQVFSSLVNERKTSTVHTALFSFNRSEVKNLYEEEVTDHQVIGRNLMKGFGIAGAQAQILYGEDVKVLPKPVVVQLVMTDGKVFHFSVLQLNTLDVDNEECPTKNLYWNSEQINLYESCGYINGKPQLIDYNEKVIRRLVAFYENQ